MEKIMNDYDSDDYWEYANESHEEQQTTDWYDYYGVKEEDFS